MNFIVNFEKILQKSPNFSAFIVTMELPSYYSVMQLQRRVIVLSWRKSGLVRSILKRRSKRSTCIICLFVCKYGCHRSYGFDHLIKL